ncbi:hypothetical protein X798_01128 [Onchocerca flexuosa]|uniref:Uncharacterized protein n=1 Tax=Onchocerca flexuosa TaxID=387005 RepID=A0A238C3B9_9BILA|nr:hypothetical protein X798_01128 [Onchocerca flexuosa]
MIKKQRKKMSNGYEAIAVSENTVAPPEGKKNQAENDVAVGKYGWSIKAMVLMFIFMPLMIACFFTAGIGFGKIWKSG